MNSIGYKHIIINGISIAYTDRGEGRPILFIHGFASSSYTWMKMIGYLPPRFRFITIDLKGFGHSEKKCDDHLSPFDQSRIVSEFIRMLQLEDLVLVGHSMGGAISLLTLFDGKMKSRISRLVLVDSAGIFQKLPGFIDDIAAASPGSRIVKMADEELLVSIVLKQAYYDHGRIDDEAIREYSGILRQEKAKECLYASAQQIAIANIRSFHEKVREISIPTLIVWGNDDAIIDLIDALKLKSDLKYAELRIIYNCGHSPQEEMPLETAGLLADFLGVSLTSGMDSPAPKAETAKKGIKEKIGDVLPDIVKNPGTSIRKMRMRRLIDRWSFGTFLFILLIKFLQFLKKIGFKAKINGWRKVTGIFLRKEHSKFILATFRINYLGENSPLADPAEAKGILIDRLAGFIRRNPDCRWTIDWGFFMTRRKKSFFTDIVEAEFSGNGDLLRIVPHFDRNYRKFPLVGNDIIESVFVRLIDAYNKTKNVDDHTRSWVIYKKLRRWARKVKGLSFYGHQELRHVVRRLMNASFIQFQTLPGDKEKIVQSRMATPDMRACSHPGFGLLNMVCRFTSDYSEADLWCQYHHVPVDGIPMQEMLQELKKEWGEAGPVLYPSISGGGLKTELFFCGGNIYRAKIYISFERLLKFRKYLNDRYYVEMGGPATVSSMIIWGLAQQKYFRDKKFIFPVDTSLIMDYPKERNISFIFMLPRKFFNENNRMEGFLKYQREFNQRVFATRLGKSESYELFELYAIVHPMFYHILRYLMPKTLGEFVGTAGLTILKDAEMFISPVSDLHFNGFVSLGNMSMPTEDGRTAGAVSICGSREQIAEYIKGFRHLAENFPGFLSIDREFKAGG
ncbi:MAG: alpha/beta hydrolase [Victivallales bacterium]